MEQHGLEQVIAELKSRGVQAGEQEASRILGEARAEAARILAAARAEAAQIEAAAQRARDATRAALEVELAQAARAGLAAFRQALEANLLRPEIDSSLQAVLDRPEVLEGLILELVQAFARGGMKASDLQVLLPATRQAELEAVFLTRLQRTLARGLEVVFDSSLRFGFRLGPRDEGYLLDLGDEGFAEILGRFLAPRFRKGFFAAVGPAVPGAPLFELPLAGS
ncbi:MAG: hypothetical protein RBU45_19610 [Myxococcota bacterium]|jgi:V/A-type H+-transporting ATPase subunit E|nr:hypothetical protein [Myxococcota bacterium]